MFLVILQFLQSFGYIVQFLVVMDLVASSMAIWVVVMFLVIPLEFWWFCVGFGGSRRMASRLVVWIVMIFMIISLEFLLLCVGFSGCLNR